MHLARLKLLRVPAVTAGARKLTSRQRLRVRLVPVLDLVRLARKAQIQVRTTAALARRRARFVETESVTATNYATDPIAQLIVMLRARASALRSLAPSRLVTRTAR